MRRWPAATLALAATVVLAACSGSPAVAPVTPSVMPTPAAELASFYDQPAKWHNCGNADCMTVNVPVDY